MKSAKVSVGKPQPANVQVDSVQRAKLQVKTDIWEKNGCQKICETGKSADKPTCEDGRYVTQRNPPYYFCTGNGSGIFKERVRDLLDSSQLIPVSSLILLDFLGSSRIRIRSSS